MLGLYEVSELDSYIDMIRFYEVSGLDNYIDMLGLHKVSWLDSFWIIKRSILTGFTVGVTMSFQTYVNLLLFLLTLPLYLVYAPSF